jgi:hypothetical protein
MYMCVCSACIPALAMKLELVHKQEYMLCILDAPVVGLRLLHLCSAAKWNVSLHGTNCALALLLHLLFCNLLWSGGFFAWFDAGIAMAD